MAAWEKFAAEMLGCGAENVPPELEARLNRVDRLCYKAGASLYSRQLIAAVIEQYQRETE